MIRLSGGFRSSLIIGGQGIRSRKLRTLLSMISLFLGVLAVVMVQAGAETARRAALADIELLQGKDGTRVLTMGVNASTMPIVLDTLRGRSDAVMALRSTVTIGEPGVRPVNPGGAPFDQPGGYTGAAEVRCESSGVCYVVEEGGKASRPPGAAIDLVLVALTGDVLPFRPYRLAAGSWLDFSSEPSMAPRLVINKEAAKGFGRYRVPAQMHQEGTAVDATPRLIGVVDDGNSQPTAYVRADEMLNWFPPPGTDQGGFDQGGVEQRGMIGVEVMMSPDSGPLEQVLRARLAAVGVNRNQLGVETVNAKKQISQQLSLIRWIFLGVASLVLLIGVAGILNVGLATVGERVEEFALRRAVGTPRTLLAGIVLAETVFTGLFTALAAIGVGVLAIKVAGRLLGTQHRYLAQLTFPWQAALAGVVAGLVAGALGGLVPAIRAARIRISSIMRA